MEGAPLYFIQKATISGTTRTHAKYLTVGGSILEFSVSAAASPNASTHRQIALRRDSTNSITLNSAVLTADVNNYVASVELVLSRYGLDLDSERNS